MTTAADRVAGLIAAKRGALVSRHPVLRPKVGPPRLPPPPFDASAIVLGRNEQGSAVLLPERPRLEHMHVIGATGSGKTNFLEHLIRQDILRGCGVCVVDPHGNHPGSLYRSLLTWLEQKHFTRSREVHLIDPNAPTHTVGFNPLHRGDSETQYSVIAEAMFEAFERMWGDEDGNSKPTIQRVLTATFTALGEQGLTLAEARLLFDPEDRNGIRALVLSRLKDSYAFDEVDWLHRISVERNGRRDFRAEVIGPINRIAKLVRTEAVRCIVGQTAHTIDLRQAMDDGHIILANLSGGTQVYEQGADLLGRLLTRFLFFHARRRCHTQRPFFIYLDEAHRYLSGDLPNILAEVRKYGVGVVLAHQWLGQLGEPDSPIREAVGKGPNLKVVFRIKDPREAAELAEAVMPLDLEMPVRALIKPTVVGHRRTLFASQSTAAHQADSRGWGEAVGQSVATTHAESWSETVSDSVSRTDSRSSADTVSQSTSDGASDSIADSTAQSIGASQGSSWGRATMRSASSGTSSGEAATMLPAVGVFGQPTLINTTTVEAASSSTGEADADSSSGSRSNTRAMTAGRTQGSSRSRGRTSGSARTIGSSTADTVGHSVATSVGTSDAVTHGESYTKSNSFGQMTGTSKTVGFTEGIEPIYANLPSAVHSKDNVLHMAAQELLSLPTGQARLSYVGEAGRSMGSLKVPRVPECQYGEQEFNNLRSKVFERSSSGLRLEDATENLKARERLLIASAKEIVLEEPATFRVPVGKGGRKDEV